MKKNKLVAVLLVITLFLLSAFSVFAEDEQYSVSWTEKDKGEVQYGDFYDAISAINSAGSGEIRLLSDVTIDKNIKVSSEIVIYSGNMFTVLISSGSTLTNNGSITLFTDMNVAGSVFNQGILNVSCSSVLLGEENVTVNVPLTVHSWDGGNITVQPTEDSQGSITYTCLLCGETKTSVIARLSSTDVFTIVLFSAIGAFFIAIIVCAVITGKKREEFKKRAE